MNTSNLDINTSNVDFIFNADLFSEGKRTYARNQRNQLLTKTDKYLIPDYPITSNQILEVKIYRQELRDYMNHFNIEIQSDFPTPPSFIPSFP